LKPSDALSLSAETSKLSQPKKCHNQQRGAEMQSKKMLPLTDKRAFIVWLQQQRLKRKKKAAEAE
jgi:hypothetical protein